jgi:predicted DsbA family dithiol-disulfide isomerase
VAIKVDYYSDILCVWAWIAQRRQEELRQQFGSEIEFNYRFINVFGNTGSQIGDKWAAKGGFEGFAQHVVDAASPFADAPVAANIWQTVRPLSSTPAHVFVKAVELSYSVEAAENFTRLIRERFFTGPIDIGQSEILLDLANEDGLDTDLIKSSLNSGAASAEVSRDYQMAQAQGIKGSPSWVLDGGRQILYGNVGYRILRANAVELLNHPQEEASWC